MLQTTISIDDFYGNMRYDYLLRLLDGTRQRLPVKGGFVYNNWQNVIITSNQHPAIFYIIVILIDIFICPRLPSTSLLLLLLILILTLLSLLLLSFIYSYFHVWFIFIT